ncbi:MAG: MaoC family dehydratase N-terminal domain-containing protein [Chloroflexi bacterium]|nr:MaoC family dehydratase N-terminal domain-containing protein [Chloroflexota bacterium]
MTFEEVKAKFLGLKAEPEIYEVEKGASKRYAVAVDDLNPAYLDDEYARSSKHGVILAPPGFYGWPVKMPSPMFPKVMSDLMEDLRLAGFPDVLDGGNEFEFLLPVRTGDILVCSRTVKDLAARGGSGGRKMALMTIESTFANTHGDIVSRMRQTVISLSSVQPS